MLYDVEKFEEFYKQGYLRKSEKGDLVLYGYTEKTTFDRHWNEYTRAARGLILEKSTGKVIAKPFPKFFNMGEMEETFLVNLPMGMNYTSFEKVDGSLGIIFNHDGQWQIATRGSFYSEQAQKGAELLKKYDLSAINSATTLLAEIIYPANKIIVDYGQEEKLVLIGAYDTGSGHEFNPATVLQFSQQTGMPHAKLFAYSIMDMVELQKTLPKDEEGFVVRFDNGLRVKIKGEEYLRIAKMLSHMSPISFWESMVDGKVPREYLAQLPEEFKKEFESIVETLESQFKVTLEEVKQDSYALPTRELSPEGRKSIGIFLRDTAEVKHKSAMFPLLEGKMGVVTKYVMKQIRPDGNDLKILENK